MKRNWKMPCLALHPSLPDPWRCGAGVAAVGYRSKVLPQAAHTAKTRQLGYAKQVITQQASSHMLTVCDTDSDNQQSYIAEAVA